jgi:hypothetical protein
VVTGRTKVLPAPYRVEDEPKRKVRLHYNLFRIETSTSVGLLMNGRTYCGYYQGYYLKSTLEYIYARYLDYMGIQWQYEVKTFSLSTGGSYKPDFLLADGSYVEVKGGFNYDTDLPRILTFEQDYELKVEIIQEKDLRKLIHPTPFIFEQLKQEWKQIANGLGMDTSGQNNPRYGVEASQSTKAKIAQKAKARLQDAEYRQKWLDSRAKSEKVQQQTENLKQYNLQRYYQVFTTCENCKKSFEVLFRKNNPQKYCSYKCSVNATRSKTFSENVQLIQKIALKFAETYPIEIMTCKLNKIKPVLEPFYEQVRNQFDIQDERTLSKALLGKQTSRKEILYYFRSLVEKVLGANANHEALELEDKEPLG